MAAPKFNVLAATAADLQSLLLNGTLSSVEIVETYFEHIERHNKKGAELNVVISLAPLDDLREQATALDAERAVFLDKQQHNGNANIRSPGPVHGIPILVKDNIMTKDFDTTCGSFALKDVKVISNADVVDSVLQASMILLGKTNLSNPCGSSSGSAAGVAAGFAPLSLGTETDGSIIQPAGRNSVFGLKVTPGLISTRGTSPYSDFSDSLGPMAHSVVDLAALLGVLIGEDYSSTVLKSFSGHKVAFADPMRWIAPPVAIPLVPELLKYQREMYVSAMEKIKADILAHGGFVAKETSSGLALIAGENNLENSKGLLPLPRVIEAAFVPQYRTPKITGKLGGIEQVWDHDFAPALEEFLKGFEDAPVKNVADLVQWNLANADRELPEEFPNGQSQLIDALSPVLSDEDCESAKTILRDKAREALDRIFDDFNVDVLIMPQDCRVSTISAEAGYPLGIAPLGYSPINGRGFGLVILAKAGREDKILEFMSSWEAENPSLLVPPQLEDDRDNEDEDGTLDSGV